MLLASCGDSIVYNTVSWDPYVCSDGLAFCMSGMSPANNSWQLHRHLLVCEYIWRGCMTASEPREPTCREIEYSCLAEAGFEKNRDRANRIAGECWAGYDHCVLSRSSEQ